MSFANLSTKELTNAVNEMVASVGVCENHPLDQIVELLRDGRILEATQKIAELLRLPVEVSLSFVSQNSQDRASARFQTTALVTTGCDGRGHSGIVAQVGIPRDLPMYGTAALTGYPVQIRIGKDAHMQPYTFIAIIAHEFSHIVMHALRHPQRHSEFQTDLIPLLLGFRVAVAKGRKVVTTEEHGDRVHTTTVTHGYLTDEHFRLASHRIENILKNRRAYIRRLRDRVIALQHKSADIEREVKRHKLYMQRVGNLADDDKSWDAAVRSYHDLQNEALEIAATAKNYNKVTINRVMRFTETLNAAIDDATRVRGKVDKAVGDVSRNVGIWSKCWIAVRITFEGTRS